MQNRCEIEREWTKNRQKIEGIEEEIEKNRGIEELESITQSISFYSLSIPHLFCFYFFSLLFYFLLFSFYSVILYLFLAITLLAQIATPMQAHCATVSP